MFNSECLILGFTFKENCPDVRNTKVIDIVLELKKYNVIPVIYDPIANKKDVLREYKCDVISELKIGTKYQAVVLAVAHTCFKEVDVRSLVANPGIIYDVKGFLPKSITNARL